MLPRSWLSVLTYLSVLWGLSAAQNFLHLVEGDICKQTEGKTWSCKSLKSCPKALQDIQNKKRPQMCKFKPSYAVVCCEPSQTSKPPPIPEPSSDSYPPGAGIKSKEMCRKYGESVYVNVYLGSNTVKLDTCAVTEPLITGGKDAETREFPHMALIGYGEKKSISWLCGGSLISERFVLSAAHCSAGNKFSGRARWVRLGEYNVKSKEDEKLGLSKPVEFEIIDIVNHPKYDLNNIELYNDIALYKLDRPVKLDRYIRPICLNTEEQFDKDFAIATGWGKTGWGQDGSSVLQKINLTLFSKEECSQAFSVASTTPQLNRGIQHVSQFCSGSPDIGGDSCPGDSGGPLQIRLRKPHCMFSQLGIVSFGGPRCGGNKPGVYTRVSYYVPWIESIVWS